MTEILEKSGNFMRGKKWEPCVWLTTMIPFALAVTKDIKIQEIKKILLHILLGDTANWHLRDLNELYER